MAARPKHILWGNVTFHLTIIDYITVVHHELSWPGCRFSFQPSLQQLFSLISSSSLSNIEELLHCGLCWGFLRDQTNGKPQGSSESSPAVWKSLPITRVRAWSPFWPQLTMRPTQILFLNPFTIECHHGFFLFTQHNKPVWIRNLSPLYLYIVYEWMNESLDFKCKSC